MIEELFGHPFHLLDQFKNILNLTLDLFILVLVKFHKVVFVKNNLPDHTYKVISKDNIFQERRLILMHSNVSAMSSCVV